MLRDERTNYWTAAESCTLLEDLAAEFWSEAADSRENMSRCQELDAVRRRAAFKLIKPKNMKTDSVTIPIGYENAFFEALEKHQKEMSEIYPA